MCLIIETVKIGGATIRVHDDSYTGKSEKEIEETIDGYCRIIREALIKKEKTA